MANYEKFGNESTRKITETWTTSDNYRVKVYTYHDKNKKVYWSIISECIVEESGMAGIYFEKHSFHNDLHRLLQSIPAPRYNYEKISAWHNVAAMQAQTLIKNLLDLHESEQVA